MIRNPTVLILGAGASFEAGFPLGTDLKEKIKQLCARQNNPRLTFEQTPTFLEIALANVRAKLPNVSQDEFHAAQLALAENIDSVDSIDQFLSLNVHSPATLLAGKTAIARAISLAEQECHLSPELSARNATPAFSNTKKTALSYLQRLWTLLATGVSQKNVSQIFDNLSIINFNYDRSLEWFLFIRLQQALGLDTGVASEIVSSLTITRPYGSVGAWRHQVSGDGIPFAFNLEGEALLRAASSIRILSDDDLERSVPPHIVRARQFLHGAKDVAILGSAFHSANINALDINSLTPSSYDGVRRVWFTAIGLETIAQGAIRQELAHTLRTAEHLVTPTSFTSRHLLDELTYQFRA